jgi:hypothetical protein
MLRRACAWTVLGLLAPLAAAQSDYISATCLNQVGLVRYWQLKLPLEADQTVNRAYLVDDQIYACTEDGFVYAVHADTGAIRWMREVSRSGYPVRRPCHAGERTIFSTPTALIEFDRLTGDGIVRRDLHFPCGTAPVSDGARVFVGGLDRRLYTFDVQTLLPSWKVGVDSPITSTPVIYNEHAYFATDRNIYGCTAADKRLLWRTTTFGTVVADLVADENGVYVANRDQSLYLLDLAFGQIRWRARFGSPLEEAPVITPSVAFQFSASDGLTAVNTASIGEQIRTFWVMRDGRSALTADEKSVYVLTRDEHLVQVGLTTGDVTSSISVSGFSIPIPAPLENTIYLASIDGHLFCARPSGTAPLRRETVLEALRTPEVQAGIRAGTTTTQPASQPTAVPRERELPRRGVPLGGKSKISREVESGGREGATP